MPTFCTNCRQPCEVVRVCYGPQTRADVDARRDSFGDGSDCCEAEVREARENPWDEYGDPD